MVVLKVTAEGEGYDRECVVELNGITIYAGYVDLLFSYSEDETMLVLNFGDVFQRIPVAIRRVGDYAVLIPPAFTDRTVQAYRMTYALSLSELRCWWDEIQYDPFAVGTMKLAVVRELRRLWKVASQLIPPEGTWRKWVAHSFLALSSDDPVYQGLFWALVNDDWSAVDVSGLVRIQGDWTPITYYGDRSEWTALRVDGKGTPFVDLGGNWGLRIRNN